MRTFPPHHIFVGLVATLVALWMAIPARGEAMVQYFNTSYRELTRKMPELAEVGYGSIWLPPPTKGSGGLSVGYDLWDRFDLGAKDQRGGVPTRYGTEAELLELMETAHRFGIRVYFDNIMNHNAFDVPGFNENVPIDIYPGMVPEDFHLRVTSEGFYRKWDNTRDWNSEWQVQNLGLADLIDIAHEEPNTNFGPNEGDDHPRITFVRQPDHPEYYPDLDLPIPFTNPNGTFNTFTFANKEPFDDTGWGAGQTGAGNGRFDWEDTNGNGQHDAGETAEPFQDTGLDPTRPGWNTAAFGFGNGRYDMGDPVAENVNTFLHRSVRWLIDRTHADGLRLDAVKHVPDYFFGATFGADKDYSSFGYLGQAQEQFNVTHGFSDWDSHRDSVFNTEAGRDDAMVFGEHLGQPPGFGGYIDAGMRLVDNDLRSTLNGNLGNPFAGLWNLQWPGGGGFAPGVSVMHAQSHDSDYAAARELQHAFYFTREGLPLIYTDGNFQAETLGESGGAFPRHANTAFLGQFGDSRIPNAVFLHNHFARGWQYGRIGDADVVAYDRVDKRENLAMDDADGAVLCFMMNDNFAAGAYREVPTAFRPGDRLWQYATGPGFYTEVSPDRKIKVIIPPGGYFAFSWRSPEASDVWGDSPILIEENGVRAGWISYQRRDGPDGDPGFNPYGVADADPTDYAYTWWVPRVTDGSNLSFKVFTDGSAEDILLKLDGGIDVNSQLGLGPTSGDRRDHPPALSTDLFLGYEAMEDWRLTEKFAAEDIARNVIGSPGAETYHLSIGSAGFTVVNSSGADTDVSTADWMYHGPTDTNHAGALQFSPAPAAAGGSPVTVSVKIANQFDVNKAYLYYTTDGSNPEGAAGEGWGTTEAVELLFAAADPVYSTIDWWSGVLPAHATGTEVRYKIGAFNSAAGSRFPSSDDDIFWKKKMVARSVITNFNATTVSYYPHNNYGRTATGLKDGFHMVRARAFLNRGGKASIFNTFKQTFYYDTRTPGGEIVFPGTNDTLSLDSYEVVVRTDATVTGVWFNIEDNYAPNDDGATGIPNGNGTNDLGGIAWQPAYRLTPSPGIASEYPDEWRFRYNNIAPGGVPAAIKVRLLELSSSTNMALTPVQAHQTELVRNVTANGPAAVMFIAFPTQDGERIGNPYDMKVRFSKTLKDGNVPNFLLTINGEAQGRSGWYINLDVNDFHHELVVPLPDLWNGSPDFLHELKIIHTDDDNVSITTTRLVKAFPGSAAAYLAINTPPEVDSDGRPFIIELPDVPTPTAEDRRYTIQVETDTTVQSVWIEFDGNVATATMAAASLTPIAGTVDVAMNDVAVTGRPDTLAGTVSATLSNSLVTGSGTAFTTDLRVGSLIGIEGTTLTVTQVVSDAVLHTTPAYPNATTSGVALLRLPDFTGELVAGSRVQIAGEDVMVDRIDSRTNLVLRTPYPGATVSGAQLFRATLNPAQTGSRLLWDFDWTGMTEGSFRFHARGDTDADTNTVEVTASRNATVRFEDVVASNANDLDDDDDGLFDEDEETQVDLPSSNPETWVNGEVHVWDVYGRSNPLKPDSDGDGLPDGLESGWRLAIDDEPFTDSNTNGVYDFAEPFADQNTNAMYDVGEPFTDFNQNGIRDAAEPYTDSNGNSRYDLRTDLASDTNGDGFPNFIGDLDPPFYNTVPDNSGLPGYVFNDSRTRRIHGTLTDAGNPDSDYDGLPDGIEDANRNGWVDGDGLPLQPTTGNPNDDRPNLGDWPDGEQQAWETWTETDPNNQDTDGDGAQDGHREDENADGRIEGDANTNRVYDAGEQWSETDPLTWDTDGDGMPDGWEKDVALDPLDNGVDNLRTAAVDDGNPVNGPDGNPDGDVLVEGMTTNDYTNLLEYQNGTNPQVPDNAAPPPDAPIVIGRGPALGVTGGVTNYEEFLDWSVEDLIALDQYEGDGSNNQGGDLFLGYDGFDSSRDLVAFYARDGGEVFGDVYFRIDFHDLAPFAEAANLDVYVVIDTGAENAGERKLPDEVDTVTDMQWEAVVAVYDGDAGAVLVDTKRGAGENTTSVFDDLNSPAFGVERRDQNHVFGFRKAYFNSELDAVEFAVSRQALRDAGWNGFDIRDLDFQVYTTRDGTCNGCNGGGPGLGDIGGRSDIRDAIEYDFIAEDHWRAQEGFESILKGWVPGSRMDGRAKVSMVFHGNEAIQPGNEVQALINTGAGAGYHRALDTHEVFGTPVNLHITPTLASAIEWAAADPASGEPWRDGPAFNDRIASLIDTNVVHLLASTFADHVMPYFDKPYNRDSVALADEYLEHIYEHTFDAGHSVFWTPERVVDQDVLEKILDAGYQYTVVDQMLHIREWFGRTSALGNAGYRINGIHGIGCFVINDFASQFLFEPHDNGLNLQLRNLMSRKARSCVQDQVVVLYQHWDAFLDNGHADAYDQVLRWLANRPWIEVVGLEEIARGDVTLLDKGCGNTWAREERGAPSLAKVARDWIHHATQENYDHWYLGQSGREEGLLNKVFQIRPGTDVPQAYGMQITGGMIQDAWNEVNAITNAGLQELARAALHASTFQTAFHDQSNNDLSKFSTGDYIYPDTDNNGLIDFARESQAQSRQAAVLRRVDQWVAAAAGMTTTSNRAEDVDLDGEDEFLLYNDRLFAVFQTEGGRLVAAWLRQPAVGKTYQVVGNLASYAGFDNEWEDGQNVTTNDGVRIAHRTSALKDWWDGSGNRVNDSYGFTPVSNGWAISSGEVSKTVTLNPQSGWLTVHYVLSGALSGGTLYVRNGLSPHLGDLLRNGQANLQDLSDDGQTVELVNSNDLVSAAVRYAGGGHSAGYNAGAIDDDPGKGVTFSTVNMRNQAQTEQVEVFGTGTFSFSLGFDAGGPDFDMDGTPDLFDDDDDNDGIPDVWENTFGLNPTNAADATIHSDPDSFTNYEEYIANTNPFDGDDFFAVTNQVEQSGDVVIWFLGKTNRVYSVSYADALSMMNWAWQQATPTNAPMAGVAGPMQWVDDGTETAVPPSDPAVTLRVYRVEVDLPGP